MKQINIKFINFWPNFNPENHIIIKALTDIYPDTTFNIINNITNNDPHILFYSVFPPKQLSKISDTLKKYDCIKIQISGEPFQINDDNYFIGRFPTNPNLKRLKLLNYEFKGYYNGRFNCYDKLKNIDYSNLNKTKFCCFITSNGGCKVRNNFFKRLCKYKKVDSCGKLFNNVNFRLPRDNYDSTEFVNFISKYKFIICFENSSYKYYTTEKLYNAFLGKVVPIYWGDPDVFDIYNRDAMIYLKPDRSNLNEVLNTIKKLDETPELYMEMLHAPKLNPVYQDYFENKMDEIKRFFDPFLEQIQHIQPIVEPTVTFVNSDQQKIESTTESIDTQIVENDDMKKDNKLQNNHGCIFVIIKSYNNEKANQRIQRIWEHIEEKLEDLFDYKFIGGSSMHIGRECQFIGPPENAKKCEQYLRKHLGKKYERAKYGITDYLIVNGTFPKELFELNTSLKKMQSKYGKYHLD